MCCKRGGLKGKPPSRLLRLDLVGVCSVMAAGPVRRGRRPHGPGRKGWGGGTCWGNASIVVSRCGSLFQCCTRSSGQVRQSLLSIGPLLYKCSIRSLAWLCVVLLYLVAAR